MVLLSLLALAGASIVNAIPTISAKGSKFFTSDGDQFYVKGIAYQLVPDDPLIDANQCGLDAELMKTLGTNSIRVYHVDPNGNHDDCMKAFADAGIYIWLDLDTFDTQVTQEKPQWTQAQYDAFAAVMDTFHSYDNLAGFFVGNEAITTANGSVTAPYIKAAARDMKKYRDDKKYRSIPIGYSAADIAQLRPNLQNYLACGQDTADSLDFFSLNAYSWCGTSSYQQSGYDILEKNSTDLHIPIFMSETGCNTVRPRDFQDQTALFGEMSDVWSGSIIYEWIEEANNYGLISYGPKVAVSPTSPPDGFPRSGKPIPVEPDFPNLSAVWASLKPSGVKEADYNPTNAPPVCPDYTAGAWEVVPTSALPTLGQQHNFGAEPTQGSGSGNGNASSAADGSASGSAQPTGSAAAAPQSFGMGAGIVGMMAVLAWL